MGKIKLSKYEKETIILSSEGDTTYSVYTYNPALKRRFAEYSKKHPECCYLEWEDSETGSQTYVIDKARFSIRLTAPYSDERKIKSRICACENGFQTSTHREENHNNVI